MNAVLPAGAPDPASVDRMPDFSDLTALYVNCTLTRSPEPSHTQRLIDQSAAIMEEQGVSVDQFRAVEVRADVVDVSPEVPERERHAAILGGCASTGTLECDGHHG